jgi:hypothetical protein
LECVPALEKWKRDFTAPQVGGERLPIDGELVPAWDLPFRLGQARRPFPMNSKKMHFECNRLRPFLRLAPWFGTLLSSRLTNQADALNRGT